VRNWKSEILRARRGNIHRQQAPGEVEDAVGFVGDELWLETGAVKSTLNVQLGFSTNI
jgi:hypothetical protein